MLSGEPLDSNIQETPLGDPAFASSLSSRFAESVYTSPVFQPPAESQSGGSGGVGDQFPAVSPFPLDQTFQLHSNPTATKVIYLDFDGHITRDTGWNTEIPNIVTPAFTTDDDNAFSDSELLMIQKIWERAAEDFRPFNINVTTEEPPLDDLRRQGPTDERWGQRVLIGGTNMDWLFNPGVGGIAMGSFNSSEDVPCFVFNVGEQVTAETISHEVGHTLGLGHDGDIVPPPPPPEPPPDPPEPPNEYYGGHGNGITSWGPIMGAPFSQSLTQWSQGEYPLATNIQDDLQIITTGKGFTYRTDDHGNSTGFASAFVEENTQLFGSGIIERTNDLDFFSFTVGVQGEAFSFEINPFQTGPNLDILAKLYNSAGVEIASSNPLDDINASFSLNLGPGTYYISIDGTGRPFQSTEDPGYTDYGSLGAYTIVGTRSALNVGVDFDVAGGAFPAGWTRYTGSPIPAVLSDLKNEGGFTTPYNLAINTGGAPLTKLPTTINGGTIPEHFTPLDNLGGTLASSIWNLTWSDLDPLTTYELFVFGLAGTAGINNVEVVGDTVASFSQMLTSNDLFVNGEISGSARTLGDLALSVVSSATGTIQISVTPESGLASLAGVAIRPTQPGAINGQVINDLNGNGARDTDEPGLPDWRVYIDENGNGVWDSNISQSASSENIPQNILNYTTVKSDLVFSGLGSIQDVDVTLDITHTYTADLDVFLISPAGTRVELFSDIGGSSDNFVGTILDDQAGLSIAFGSAPYTGRFKPEGLLSVLNGENPNGLWTLEITDDAGENTGVLTNWSLTIVGSEVSTLTDEDGFYSFGELPPGSYQIGQVIPSGPGWEETFAPPPATVTSGANVQDIDFGNWIPEIIPGTIEGAKWEDLNGDGQRDAGEDGLAGWRIYVDGNGNGEFDQSILGNVASTDAPKAITDFKTTISQIEFSGLNSITEVEVTLDITHSYVHDLDVYLISPSGRQVELFTGVGDQLNDFQGTTLSDDAAVSILDGEAPYSGAFRPEGLLSDFLGEDPNGTWQLLIRDTRGGDEGTLNSWSLEILGDERSVLTDENGNYAFTDLDPGFYLLREVEQPGWIQTAPTIPNGQDFWSITLANDSSESGIDFGNQFVGVQGDYNDDGFVNAADFVFWRDRVGAGGAGGGDGSGNGTVGPEDYDMWHANFGAVVSGSGAGAGEAMAAATSSDDSTSEPLVASFSASGDSASSAATLASDDAVARGFGSRGSAAQRPTSAAPDANRADSALLAWLAGLGEDDRPERPERTRFDWDFAGERDRSDRSDHFTAAIDSAFENLGV